MVTELIFLSTVPLYYCVFIVVTVRITNCKAHFFLRDNKEEMNMDPIVNIQRMIGLENWRFKL